MAFYSSLAVSHDAEVHSRTIEAKTQLSSAILAAYKQIGAAHAEIIDKLFYWMNIVIARQRIDSLPMLALPDDRIRAWFEVSL